jgi:DNA-directed RNA polymerase alpha subunit
MIDPSPELPDDMPIASVELPPKVQQALIAAGLRTIGKIRETSDTEILRIQNLGQSSLNFLRDTMGLRLPCSMGVRSDAIPIPAKPENRGRRPTGC